MYKYVVACLSLIAISVLPLHARSQEPADQELRNTLKGKIRHEDAEDLQQYDNETAKWLADAPNDPTGKQSSLYPKLQAWRAGLHQLASSHKQADAFKLIPLMVAVFTADKPEGAAAELRQVQDRMNDCGSSLIMAAGACVKQHHGKVDAATLSNFVKLFSVAGFFMEPDWEDRRAPIAPAGFVIINPTAVVRQLESAPWEQAQRFVGGITSPTDFFAVYAAKGEGLAVLKTKYAAKQTVIDAKFRELVAWKARQEKVNAH